MKYKAIYKNKEYDVFAIVFWSQYIWQPEKWVILWEYNEEKELDFIWDEFHAMENVIPFNEVELIKIEL